LILSFLYRNVIDINCPADALELHKLAQFFGIESLTYICEKYIFSSIINSDTVCQLWNCSKELKADNLSEKCQEYFVEHFIECSQTRDFLELDKDLFKMALTAGQIDADSVGMFEALKNWGTLNATKYGKPTEELMGELLPPKTLFNQKIKYALLNPKTGTGSPTDFLFM